MTWIAFRMLTGEKKKYLVIIFGVAFASMMMAHQMSVFWGVMLRTVNQIRDVHPEGIWVMNPNVQYVDEAKPMPEAALQRVRGVAGVAWAVPLFKGLVRVQPEQGRYRDVMLLGIDDATLIGAPRKMVLGSMSELRRPDAVILDKAGYTYLWPGEPLRLGRFLEINERRAVLVGICHASPPFQTLPIMYTRFHQAVQYAPPERNALSFVLVQPAADVAGQEVCQRIQAQTGLLAMPAEEFCKSTMVYYFRYTGIPINFGIVVFLGFVVGIAIAGQNFYLFTVENLRQFGVLKAMGVTNAGLIGMITLQAAIVGLIGFGIGIGLAALLIEASTANVPHLAGFFLPWQIMAISGSAILVIMLLASLVCIRRVLVLEPMMIFRT